jgi:hypothetical protein
MSLQASFPHIDRHAAWGARPASAAILLGLGMLVGAGAVFAPEPAAPGPGTQVISAERASAAGLQPAAPCLPHDAALGAAGGDPYGFYVFNRDQALATQRAGCGAALARILDEKRMPSGHEPAPRTATALTAQELAPFVDMRGPAELHLVAFPQQVDVNSAPLVSEAGAGAACEAAGTVTPLAAGARQWSAAVTITVPSCRRSVGRFLLMTEVTRNDGAVDFAERSQEWVFDGHGKGQFVYVIDRRDDGEITDAWVRKEMRCACLD